MRVIALNRRDYVGSTPFSEVELSMIRMNDVKNLRAFLKDRGREILLFLIWLIEHKGIPRAKEGGGGGLALLGWSLGNVTTLVMLAFLGEYEEELVRKVQPWLTSFIIYGELLACVQLAKHTHTPLYILRVRFSKPRIYRS